MTKSYKLRCIELDHGQSIEALVTAGIARGQSLGEIADTLGVARLTLRTWCRQLGMEIERQSVVRFKSEKAVVG